MVGVYTPIVVVISSIIGAGESVLAMTTALNGKVGVCHVLHQRQSAGKVTMRAKANTAVPTPDCCCCEGLRGRTVVDYGKVLPFMGVATMIGVMGVRCERGHQLQHQQRGHQL